MAVRITSGGCWIRTNEGKSRQVYSLLPLATRETLQETFHPIRVPPILTLTGSLAPDYFDQVYAGIVCPFGSAYAGLCSLDDATVIQFDDSQPVVMEVDFVLGPRVTIFANGFD